MLAQVSARARLNQTAICFMLARPRQESRAEAIWRGIRFLFSRLPLLRRVVAPRWSPARRMGYAAGLRACVQSIRRLHPSVPPILVLRPVGQELTMADVDGVIPFDPAPYEAIPCTGSYFGREVFYKLELFKLRGFERIVYLDCDTLVVDDISSLWDPAQYAEHGFYAVREQASMGVAPMQVDKFNTGVMVINRPLLADVVYHRMLQLAQRGASYDGGDQGVIHAYLEQAGGRVAGELDAGYNVLVRAKREGDWDTFKDRLKVLHFVNGLKPWSDIHHYDWMFDAELKRMWDEAYRWVPNSDSGQPDQLPVRSRGA